MLLAVARLDHETNIGLLGLDRSESLHTPRMADPYARVCSGIVEVFS